MQNKKYGTQEFERLKKEFEDSQKKLKEARKKLERVIIEDELESLREEGFIEPLNILGFSEQDIEAMLKGSEKEKIIENATDFPSTDPKSKFMELCDDILNCKKNDNPNKLKIHELVKDLCDGETENKIPESFRDEVNKLNEEKCEMDKGSIGRNNDKGEKMGNEEMKKNVEEVGREIRTQSYNTAKELIGKRRLPGNRMGINDDQTNTNLLSKHYSPMFIRKYNASCLNHWPIYISMICDEDVSDLDSIVNGILKAYEDAGLIGNNLQSIRNLTGIISETLSQYYNSKKENCVEGIGCTIYADKFYAQSLSGDYMNHLACRTEYIQALMTMTQI